MFELSQSFIFESAHTLTRIVPVQEYAASKRIHGHTYTATVTIQGSRNSSGMVQVRKPGKRIEWQVVDLFYLREEIEKVRTLLDHQFLDDVPELGAATLENICVFIADRIRFPVHSVTVSRVAGDSCRYFTKHTSQSLPATSSASSS